MLHAEEEGYRSVETVCPPSDNAPTLLPNAPTLLPNAPTCYVNVSPSPLRPQHVSGDIRDNKVAEVTCPSSPSGSFWRIEGDGLYDRRKAPVDFLANAAIVDAIAINVHIAPAAFRDYVEKGYDWRRICFNIKHRLVAKFDRFYDLAP